MTHSMGSQKKHSEPRTNGHQSAQIESSPPAYFVSLTIKNARCFGEAEQTLELADRHGHPAQWTVLLGNNGTGKTTVLQALAGFTSDSILVNSAIEGRALLGVQMLERFWTGAARQVPGKGFAELGVRVSFAQSLNGEPRQSRKNQYKIKVSSKGTSSPTGVSWASLEEGLSLTPRCYAYGASRRIGAASLSARDTTDFGIETLFSDGGDVRSAEEWLLRLDYSASKDSDIQPQQVKRRELVENLLIKILPDVDNILLTKPNARRPVPAVNFSTPYGWVALRQLGYGYQSMIAWIVDFASRMVERYPDSKNPLAEPAVVLVDEIDLHLHPSWQRQIMQYLGERFPNTQFIVTAHSPLIVQAADEKTNIAVLRREGDHVVIENGMEVIRGWRIDQVLTSDLFGLRSARPASLDKALDERKRLLTKAKLTEKDKRRLAEIDTEIGSLPTGETRLEAARMRDLAEETLRLVKQQQG